MPSRPTHRILRRVLEVSVANRDHAASWRQWSRDLWDRRLARALGDALDQASPNGDVLRVPRLSIELRLEKGTDETSLTDDFVRQLREGLLTDPAPRRRSRETPPSRIPAAGRRRACLECFLRFGAIPWWAPHEMVLGLAGSLLEECRLTSDGGSWLRSLVLSTTAVPRRLALQFGAGFHHELLEQVAPSIFVTALTEFLGAHPSASETGPAAPGLESEIGALWIEGLWRSWADGTTPGMESITRALRFLQLALSSTPRDPAAIDPGTGTSDLPVVTAAALRQLHPTLPSDRGRLADALVSVLSSRLDPEAAAREWRSDIPPPAPRTGETHGSRAMEPSARPDEDSSEPEGSPSVVRPAAPSVTATAPREGGHWLPEAPAPVDRAFPVSNAGLVLVAPFLPRFLAALGIGSAAFGDANDLRLLCPLLIQYVATGEADAPEASLVLPKILSGLPIEIPVPRRIPDAEPVRAESEALLAAMIGQWSALRQTSVAGFRSSFLQRPGLLREADGEWVLHVEHRPWDALLDHVPWTFRTLKLDWMPQLLTVVWASHG